MSALRDTLGSSASRRLVIASLGWVAVAFIEALAYAILAWAITKGEAPGIVVAVAVAAVAVTVLVSRHGYLTGAGIAGDLYRRLGEALTRTRLGWFDHRNRALVTSVAGPGIMTIMGLPAHQLQTLVLSVLLPVFVVVASGIVSGWGFAICLLILLIGAFALQTATQYRLARADAARHSTEQSATDALLEFTDHLDLFRTATGRHGALLRVEHEWEAHEEALAATNRASSPATFLSSIASLLPLAGMLIVLSLSDGTSPYLTLATLMLVARASAPIDDLALFGITAGQLRATLVSYRAVTTQPALPEPPIQHARQPSGLDLVLRDVTHAPVLKNVTVKVPFGSTTVITGQTGTGKSTLLGLMMRFTDPDSGTAALGGVPLGAMTYSDLVRHIALVPQDPVLFTGTIAENIRLGDPAATDDDVIAAARRAGLGTLVDRVPAGIDAQVGDHGGALSGGERQRVALARALLKRAPILLLDEPVAALDDAIARTIAEAVAALPGTAIVVTHGNTRMWHPTHTIDLDEEET